MSLRMWILTPESCVRLSFCKVADRERLFVGTGLKSGYHAFVRFAEPTRFDSSRRNARILWKNELVGMDELQHECGVAAVIT